MNVDIEKLEALAKSFPELDFDSNTEPFFNGPSGESLGGGSTGFYCVYGQPFEIDGDQYDGNEYVSVCTKEFAEFICTAKPSVLELIDSNKRLKAGAADAWEIAQSRARVIDQLKAENEALRRLSIDATNEAHDAKEDLQRFAAEEDQLRKDAERYRWLRDQHNNADGDIGVYNGRHILKTRAELYDLHLDFSVDELMAAMIEEASCTHSAN